MFGALLALEMFDKRTAVWHEAHLEYLEVNMLKTFQNTVVSGHFWRLRCSKVHALWREARVAVKVLKC